MDWILSLLSCIMLWMMGNRNKYAPLLGIFAQVLWIYYAISLKQYGLLLGALLYTVVHIRNTILWWKEDK